MARTHLIAGNWKMHLSPAEGRELVTSIASGLGGTTAEILVCPTALGIADAIAAAAGSKVQVGAQNCHWEVKGAFTGELSAELIQSAGCSHVLLGHSERRQFFHETDETVSQRLKAVLRAGLVPVLCIGETLSERESGQLETVLRQQITGALAGIDAAQLTQLVVAYEPVWAIGTGVVASTEQAQEAHAFVRSVLAGVLGDLANDLRILYGGSVKPGNAAELLAQPDIDGALVGGASLKAEDFLGIIAAA
ncbi:MAG: triose-phosphate isomerase [Planctomycetota bacterium]|nr:MAG: triose-phosphate isomerase [Planctomycetota bacterium]